MSDAPRRPVSCGDPNCKRDHWEELRDRRTFQKQHGRSTEIVGLGCPDCPPASGLLMGYRDGILYLKCYRCDGFVGLVLVGLKERETTEN